MNLMISIAKNFFLPSRHALCFSAKGNHGAATPISGLSGCGRPLAVFWLIISIIISSVKCMFWSGSQAHVGKEVLKRIAPSITNCNPSPAVSWPSLRLFITASVNHPMPNTIFARITSAMFRVRLFIKAATGSTSSRREGAEWNVRNCATLATARIKSGSTITLKIGLNNCQPLEFHSYAACGQFGYSVFSHEQSTPVSGQTRCGVTSASPGCFIIRVAA